MLLPASVESNEINIKKCGRGFFTEYDLLLFALLVMYPI